MLQVQKTQRIWPLRVLAWLFDATPRWLHYTVATLAVGGVILSVWQGEAIRTALKAWQSRRLVAEARELIQEDIHQREGVQLLLEAWKLSPKEPGVIRALAQTSSEIGLPHYARFFYTQLPRFEPLTPEDELDLASALVRLSDHTGARVVLDEFERSHGETADLRRAQASLATQAGDAAAARAAMEKVIQLAPDDNVARLQHAASLANALDSQQHTAGLDALLDQFEKTISEGDLEGRNHCFWTLAGQTMADPARRARFSQLISRMPWQGHEREVTRHLLGYPLPLSEESRADLRTWIRALLLREARTLTATDRLAITRLLQRHQEHFLALEVIPHDLSLQDSGLCAARLDSLMAEKLTSEAAQLVTAHAVPLQRHVQVLFQAWIALANEGTTSEAIRKLGEAMEEAQKLDQQGSYIAIAHLARRFGVHRAASEALAAAFHPQFPVATHLLPELLDSARQGGSTATETLRLMAQREQLEPWNLDLHRQSSCLRLLCGETVEQILEESRVALKQDPKNVYAAFLAAFASHRLQLHADAAGYLEQLNQPYPWQPHERAAMTSVLIGVGQEKLALEMAGSIPASTPLFPEEKRLIQWR